MLHELVEAAREGDPRATQELIRRTQDRVHHLCSCLGSGTDVEDLVQDTYLRALRSLPNFRGSGDSFVPWLLTIARNTCADEVRRRVRRRGLLDRLHAGRERTTDTGYTGWVELDGVVAALPPEQREAFVLTQVIGLSYEDAASVCGCPIGTIRSRVARARVAMVSELRAAEA
ncbi:MAG: sigma-70 family RNA polymerase sigma factor [Acidimicrobiales bacterium]